jgi:hypothetical protein
MRRAVVGLLLCAGVSLPPLSAQAQAMRCGTSLVKSDSSLDVVRESCGPPSTSVHRVEHRTRGEADRHGHVTVYEWDVAVDQLTYDFGPTEFMYHLTFEDGRMVAMVRGTWGTAR